MSRVLGMFALLVLFAGCPPEPEDGDVTGRWVGDELVVQNNSSRTIYVFAVGQETAHLIDWAPVNSEESEIWSGEERGFQKEGVMGADESVLIVNWWHDPSGKIHWFHVE